VTSAYFDAADRDLQAHSLLLRRREADDDAGWQLKAPDANGRIEIRYPLSDTMPPELSAPLAGVRLGKQLVNVATARRPVPSPFRQCVERLFDGQSAEGRRPTD
jgi:inorganic triphosphatase YgiF